MITLGLPYRVVGGLRFYERQEIRDAIAYLRVMHSPSDDLAFEPHRQPAAPRRGGRGVARHARRRPAPDACRSRPAAAQVAADGTLKGRVAQAVRDLLQDFGRWREMLERDGHVVTAATVLDESGYTAMWKNDKSPEAPGRLENLKELVRALADFETMAGFLDHVSLVMENEQDGETDRAQPDDAARRQGAGVRHGVPAGLGGGGVPVAAHAGRERQQGAGGGAAAWPMSASPRARRRAIISHAANRRIYAQWQSALPSRFIDELPDAHVERAGSAAMGRRATADPPPPCSAASSR